MKKKISRNRKNKNIKKINNKNKTSESNKINSFKEKKIKVIKEDFYEEDKIKDEIKDFYLMSEELYYSDTDDDEIEEKENTKLIFENNEEDDDETEENHLKIKNKSDKFNNIEENCCCDEDFIDCGKNFDSEEDDDLRFQYNRKIMQAMDDEDEENYQYLSKNKRDDIIPLPVEEKKSWSDDPQKLKFQVGDVVVYKNNKNGPTYKVCYPSQKENFYVIKQSGSLSEWEVFGDLIEKAPKNNNKWVSYWQLNPIIPAPKNFKKQQQ